MNSYQIRTLAVALVVLLVLTAFFLLIPHTQLVIVGFVFCILGIAEFFGSLVFLAGSTRKDYLVNTSFPFVTSGYAIAAVAFSFLIAALDCCGAWTMPLRWFLFVQIIFAAVLAIMLLLLGMGKDHIEYAGGATEKYANWKNLLSNVEAILAKTSAESRKDVTAVRDAVRYADPMSSPALIGLEQEIYAGVTQLAQLVEEKKASDIAALCVQIQNQLKDRSKRLQSLK